MIENEIHERINEALTADLSRVPEQARLTVEVAAPVTGGSR